MTADTVLDIFKDITRIPRESGHEGPMTAFLQEFAAKRHLECRTDRTGNVVIVKEAAPGKENVPILVLQAPPGHGVREERAFRFRLPHPGDPL